MKFLVTGCAGFIGHHLVLHLLQQGYDVVGIDNLETGLQSNIDLIQKSTHSKKFVFHKEDIRAYDALNKMMKDVDYVLHQAALGSVPRSIAEPEIYNDNNIIGTFNVLKAARDNKVKRVVFASSSSVYGDTEELPKHEKMETRPLSPYALSKLTGEHYCKIFYRQYGLETVALRYFNIFGPRQSPESQYAAAIPIFIKKISNNEPPQIHGDGEQTRDFTYLDNVIQANLAACFSKDVSFGDSYNIGCGDRISINDLTEAIKDILNIKIENIYTETRAGDVKDSLASTDKSTKAKLIRNPITLSEGLLHTINYYKKEEK
jgi:nucleoside-diphosphate-sugar epimerase